MLHIDLIAVGRLKAGPLYDLYDEYARRLKDWQLTLHEIDDRKPPEAAILARLENLRYVFVLDERGKPLDSESFSRQLQSLEDKGMGRIGFVIGGADGHSDKIRAKADFLLSFGIQTWPHMMVRVMLAEQIYRARQIATGHPYHRA